jgi:hypothetical protein
MRPAMSPSAAVIPRSAVITCPMSLSSGRTHPILKVLGTHASAASRCQSTKGPS